jgi:hypothetical protein
MAVVGSWTSLILVEQAIFHHLAKLVTWPWLLLSSLSLGRHIGLISALYALTHMYSNRWSYVGHNIGWNVVN